jgi:hypothetical protein
MKKYYEPLFEVVLMNEDVDMVITSGGADWEADPWSSKL